MAKLTVEDILSRCEKLLAQIAGSGGASGNVDITGNSAGLNVESTQTQVRTHVGTLSDSFGSKGDSAATSDTGTFSFLAFVKRNLQNFTTLLSRIPAMNLGSGTQAGALRVTLATDGVAALGIGATSDGIVARNTNGSLISQTKSILYANAMPSVALGALAVGASVQVKLPKVLALHKFLVRATGSTAAQLTIIEKNGATGSNNGMIQTTTTITGNDDYERILNFPYVSGSKVSTAQTLNNDPMIEFQIKNTGTVNIDILTYLGY